MPKLHICFLFGQHPILCLKLIAQLHEQIRNPYLLPHQIAFGNGQRLRAETGQGREKPSPH